MRMFQLVRGERPQPRHRSLISDSLEWDTDSFMVTPHLAGWASEWGIVPDHHVVLGRGQLKVRAFVFWTYPHVGRLGP